MSMYDVVVKIEERLSKLEEGLPGREDPLVVDLSGLREQLKRNYVVLDLTGTRGHCRVVEEEPERDDAYRCGATLQEAIDDLARGLRGK